MTPRDDILRLLRPRLVAAAAARGAGQDAEDLAQDVLVLLTTKYGHVDGLDNLVPLGIRILQFKLKAWHRKTWRRNEHQAASDDVVDNFADDDPSLDPEFAVRRRQLVERLEAGLARLSTRCRELFKLKVAGMAFADIQSRMGATSINTVYTWDFRCRRALLEQMGGSWEA